MKETKLQKRIIICRRKSAKVALFWYAVFRTEDIMRNVCKGRKLIELFRSYQDFLVIHPVTDISIICAIEVDWGSFYEKD